MCLMLAELTNFTKLMTKISYMYECIYVFIYYYYLKCVIIFEVLWCSNILLFYLSVSADAKSQSRHLCMCVCVLVVPFDCPHSSLSIPPSVKRAKTRRENMMVSISSSASEEAIYLRLLPQLYIDSFISEIIQHHMT